MKESGLGKISSFIALTMVGLLALSSGCAKKAELVLERPPAPVTVAATLSANVPIYLDEMGKCSARETVSIEPQITGRITKIHFTDGADIKAGQLLFTIDSRPLEAELQRAQANLAKDISLKEQAEANLARDMVQLHAGEVQLRRYQTLMQQGVVSKEQSDQYQTAVGMLNAVINSDKAAVQSAKEALEADKAVIESVKVQLTFCAIHSPIDGRAGQRLTDIGNVVTAGSGKSLLVIQRLDPIYADFAISQNNLSAVQRAQGRLKAEVRLPDEPDNPRFGELTFLDNEVQDETGGVKLRATIPNSDRRFWPGRFVKIRLVLGTLDNAVLIPASAPQMSAKGTFVYVIKDDATAELRPVTVGQRQGENVVIEQGLTAGERVVIGGQMAVIPGSKVRIEEPPPDNTKLPAASPGGDK